MNNSSRGRRFHRSRRGLAVASTLALMAGLISASAGPASATQLGSSESNIITVPNTDVATAGVGGMRGSGEGSLTLSGVSGTVTKALLYWEGPTNSSDPAANQDVTFADQSITGTNIGFSSDNCWGFDNSQGYRADVTTLVPGDGTYALSNFRKTDGENVIADINGVSLVVFFDDGNPANNKNVTLIDGNDSNFTNPYDPDGWDATINNVVYSSGPAILQFHVADGQSYEDPEVDLNDTTLAPTGSTFQGDSVPGGPDGLWDIKSFDITSFVSSGSNDLHVTAGPPVGQDCLALVALMAVVDVVPTSTADLAVTKSDTDPGYGPDPVSSDGFVGYKVSVTNNGPDDATGVTVVDSPSENSSIQSGSGTNWSCPPPSENTVTCTYTGNEGVLPAGQTAEPLTIVVQAPTTTEDTTMSDTATVSGDQEDPNSENNSATESTSVIGSGNPTSKDDSRSFFDNVHTLTFGTTRDTTGRSYTSFTIHPDAGLQAGPVFIHEIPATDQPTFCGGQLCDAPIQISGLPGGQ